jgi:hypothetical protein
MFLHFGTDMLLAGIARESKTALRLTGLACLCLAAACSLGQEVHPAVAPPPRWVSPLAVDRRSPPASADAPTDARWLLIDRQINPLTDEQFVHEVLQIAASAAPPQITIHFDPACQVVTLHWVRVRRGTNVLNRIDPSKLQFVRRAFDPDPFLFGADRIAVMKLDDVRPGDILDYAYTVEGSNPTLEAKFVGIVPAQFPEPVDHMSTKLIWPRGRKLYVKDHGDAPRPSSHSRSNLVDYTWDSRNVPGLRMEPRTPPWFQPCPWVQLSEFQTWTEVSQWASRWLKSTNALSPAVTNLINQWRALPEPADRAEAALLFAQEAITNVGPADGASGFVPLPPSSVVARRYGDDKEKALLLVALLRALHVEAFPVLVSTRWQGAVAEFQPSPILFDHAIIAAEIEGQTCWIDPTATYERGPLVARSRPSYGFGLPVRPGGADLTPIPPCPVQPRTVVSSYFMLGTLHGVSSLRTVTVAEGADADQLRQYYATTPKEDVDLEGLKICAKYYPQIRRTQPTVLNDDPQDNRIEITEFYEIDGMWYCPPNENEYHCHLYGISVAEAMDQRPELGRTMPWALRHPVHRLDHIEAVTGTSLPVIAGPRNVEHPDFFFRRASDFANSKLVLEYEYRSLNDFVPTDAIGYYVHQVEAAMALQGVTLVSLEVH